MYNKIVVPLDGSKLAECALPHLEELAKGCRTGRVFLVSVTQRIVGRSKAPEVEELYKSSGTSREFAGQDSYVLGKKEKQAQRYLDRIARELTDKGIRVETQVLMGKPPEEIASFTERHDADLIIIASHGRSGPNKWAFGSVAEKILKASPVPVFIVRAPGCEPTFGGNKRRKDVQQYLSAVGRVGAS